MHRLWTAVAVGLVAMTGVGSGIFKQHTRPKLLPGVPARDYQHGPPAPVTEARSTVAILVQGRPNVEGTKTPRPRVKFYQLKQASLQLDHCFVSRFALMLREDGLWTMSCRADQNPIRTGEPTDVTALRDELTPRFTDHLKRNQFTLRVRGLGMAFQGTVPNGEQGQPVLLRLEPPPFWVQRQQPYDFVQSGRLPQVTQYFDLIEHVEVEFSYR